MNKTGKLLRLLAGLGEEVTVRDVVEVHMDDGYTHIDITVDHKSHIRPCDKCGSERVINLGYFAWHIPLGKRTDSFMVVPSARALGVVGLPS